MLLKDGEATRVFLSDGTVRAQYRSRHGFLLLVDGDGCHWECGAQIVLLSEQLSILDVVDVFLPWVPGCIEKVRVTDDATVEFQMVDTWSVYVRERPRRLPRVRELLGWPILRPTDFGETARYLDVSRSRRPRGSRQMVGQVT